ncbi:hypothetical protein ULMS_00800 [Patiriisocius marinistellae]|uniref:DUF350 domain-containing protein n=1 Tax=Patiriisocius marinistellae TaxID=2494560 RepID=A0A5J4FUC5_9FLAO|nr:DUF350 domain-containing protein [Patiriisocius marinistellae]GEQ84572.1 hypothetical protein ULMS_00800 [Patiriisocius marinistellae]
MNSQLFTLALLEIILSIIIAIVIMFASYKVLIKLFFKDGNLNGENLAFTIFTSGIVLSIGLILSEILPSITNVIRIAMADSEAIDVVEILTYSGLYLFIGFLAAALINGAVFLLFSLFTKGINEFKEIQQNNTSVAILVVAIMISITLIVKDSIALLISALVPYPTVTNFM